MPHQQAMADLFARHMDAELAGDLETTLATMTDNPHLVNVPSMVGGAGREGVRAFYADHLVGKFFPPASKPNRRYACWIALSNKSAATARASRSPATHRTSNAFTGAVKSPPSSTSKAASTWMAIWP